MLFVNCTARLHSLTNNRCSHATALYTWQNIQLLSAAHGIEIETSMYNKNFVIEVKVTRLEFNYTFGDDKNTVFHSQKDMWSPGMTARSVKRISMFRRRIWLHGTTHVNTINLQCKKNILISNGQEVHLDLLW